MTYFTMKLNTCIVEESHINLSMLLMLVLHDVTSSYNAHV